MKFKQAMPRQGGRATAIIIASVWLACAGIFPSKASAATWWRIQTEHFEILTDASPKAARQLAVQLEQLREVFHEIPGAPAVPPLPVRVFLFSSAEEFAQYRPGPSTRGFFQGGPDRDFIVLLDSGEETRRIAFHEYVHLVLNHSAARLPNWFEEGIAEFYSSLQLRGGDWIAGLPVRAHLQVLQQQEWLPAGTLAEFDEHRQGVQQPGKLGIFYAQSWALVHMLNLSPGYRDKLPRFAELLALGEPAGPAFEQAFGKSLEQALFDLRAYVQRGPWPALRIPWGTVGEVDVELQPLSPEDQCLALVDLQLRLGLWEVSEQTLERMARRKENSPEVALARALLALSRGDRQQAQQHFEAAIRLGSRDASTYFEYAMLLREQGAPPSQVRHWLEQAVQRNPHHAEAHFLLGLLASAEGQQEQSLEHLRRAAEILPRQANFWHALALTYHKAGLRELALRAARRAWEASQTEQERQMAQAALDLVRQEPAPALPSPGPAVRVPESWEMPQGEMRAEGWLERLDCRKEQAWLYVRTLAGTKLVLGVRDPSRVRVAGMATPKLELACGPQQPRRVVVEYTATNEDGVDGLLTALEFP